MDKVIKISIEYSENGGKYNFTISHTNKITTQEAMEFAIAVIKNDQL